MMRRAARLGLVGVASLAAGVACYGPTEVRLDISTDLPCLAVKGAGAAVFGPVHTLVRLGGAVDAPVVADTTACNDQAAEGFRDIGSIVLVPSGGRTARVTVQVSATADGSSPEACGRPETPPHVQAQCIVARRTFTFIEHTSRGLPIRLYAACRGQVCSATETCNKFGSCESAVVGETGCTASDPTCQVPVPAPLPDAASDAGDATVGVDAADAAPVHVLCTSATGTNELTLGQGSDLLAVNRTRLFFVGASASGSSVAVSSIDTTNPGPPAVLFSEAVGLGSATALAADESAVWLATNNGVYRHDLATGVVTGYKLPSSAGLATANVLPAVAGGQPRYSAFAVTATADPATGKPSGAVYRLDPNSSDPVPYLMNLPGTTVAASNAPASAVFVLTPLAYGGPGLNGAPPGSTVVQSIKAAEPFGGLASDGATAFFAAGTSVQRVDLPAIGATSLYDVTVPGPVVVDATSVFFVQRGADVAVFRGGRGGNDGPLLPAARLATGYSAIQGLAADDACVYFWSSSGLGAFSTLNVYPKTRVVPGASIPVHTP
jgi:hypothetical protein